GLEVDHRGEQRDDDGVGDGQVVVQFLGHGGGGGVHDQDVDAGGQVVLPVALAAIEGQHGAVEAGPLLAPVGGGLLPVRVQDGGGFAANRVVRGQVGGDRALAGAPLRTGDQDRAHAGPPRWDEPPAYHHRPRNPPGSE